MKNQLNNLVLNFFEGKGSYLVLNVILVGLNFYEGFEYTFGFDLTDVINV